MTEDLREKLNKIYTNLAEEERESLYEALSRHENIALPKTPEMLRYQELQELEKNILEEKEQLKLLTRQQYNLLESKFQGVTFYTSKRRTIDDFKFYEWAKSFVHPALLKELKVNIIDYEKWEEYHAKGKIEYDTIPESVYSISSSDCVRYSKKN